VEDEKISQKIKNNDEPTHLSRSLLEICNKLIVSSSLNKNSPAECWFNNKNVYKILEVCVCDYYAERLNILSN